MKKQITIELSSETFDFLAVACYGNQETLKDFIERTIEGKAAEAKRLATIATHRKKGFDSLCNVVDVAHNILCGGKQNER